MPANLEDILSKIENLSDTANKALAVELNDVDAFLSLTATYLNDFESFSSKFSPDEVVKSISSQDKKHLSQLLQELNRLHGEIVLRSTSSQTMVTDVISDVHKRSKALKKYVDTFPDRISITKNKEG